jgi:Na+/pantothenate symporter
MYPAVSGVMIAAAIAAMMSTVDSQLLVAAPARHLPSPLAAN